MHTKRNALIVLICGVVLLALGFGFPILALLGADSAAAGIIGGADAPTLRFMLSNILHGFPYVLISFGISIVLSSGFCLLFSKTVEEHCSIRSSAIALGLSAVSGAGLYCALVALMITLFNGLQSPPIRYPISIAGGFVCLAIFIVLYALYYFTRKAKFTVIGLILDVLTGILYLPGFLHLFAWLDGLIT